MNIIYNTIIPLKGFKCINLFGVLFTRKGETLSERNIQHEYIHTLQMKELLYIGFYLWYILEWIFRLFLQGNAYRNISFEKEAYCNESNKKYICSRKKFAWTNYFK